MLLGETYQATTFKNGNGTKAMLHINTIEQNIKKQYFHLQFLRTADKQTIALPLNKDHCATYYQGEISIP